MVFNKVSAGGSKGKGMKHNFKLILSAYSRTEVTHSAKRDRGSKVDIITARLVFFSKNSTEKIKLF